MPAIQRETVRYLEAAGLFLAIARGVPSAPDDAEKHFATIDVLSRDIREFTAHMLDPTMPYDKADLVASLIEEEDWTASLGETLYQVARRIERQTFSQVGRELVDATLDQIAEAMRAITPATQDMLPVSRRGRATTAGLFDLARALPEARHRAALGRARRDPHAPGQRRAGVLPDRAHRCRAPVGVALVRPAAAEQPREAAAPFGGAAVPA